MSRIQIPKTNLYVRNFGRGRSRIMVIEPEAVERYDPIRIEGCSVILFNQSVVSELDKFYKQVASRPKRNEIIPGGIGSTADDSIKRFLRL